MGWPGRETGRVCSKPTTSRLCGIYLQFEAQRDTLRKNMTLCDIEELLEPLERAISDALIPSITGYTYTTSERKLLALPVRKGGLENPVERAGFEHAVSLQVTAPLVVQIVSQAPEPPDDALIRSLLLITFRERDVRLDDELEDLRTSLPEKTKRAVDLAAEKGASSWLTVIPVKEMDQHFKRENLKMQSI